MSGIAYADINQNGIYDKGDKPLAGRPVSRHIAQKPTARVKSPKPKLHSSIKTDANGRYTFSNVIAPAFWYHIKIDMGKGYGMTQMGDFWDDKETYKIFGSYKYPKFGESEPEVVRDSKSVRVLNGYFTREHVNFGKLIAPLPAAMNTWTDSEVTFLLRLNLDRLRHESPPAAPAPCGHSTQPWNCPALAPLTYWGMHLGAWGIFTDNGIKPDPGSSTSIATWIYRPAGCILPFNTST